MNLRLVVNIAKHYLKLRHSAVRSGGGGQSGLIHALEKFDPERGFRFSTYATQRIRRTSSVAIMNQSRAPSGLPGNTVKESIQGPGVPSGSLKQYTIFWPPRHVGLALTRRWTRPLSIGESPPTMTRSRPDVQIQDLEVETLVREWISQLSEKQRMVIRHRYGLDECEVRTLEEFRRSFPALTRERSDRSSLRRWVTQADHQAAGALKDVLL